MGLYLVLNFNNPYLATGLGEFLVALATSAFPPGSGTTFIFRSEEQDTALNMYRNLFAELSLTLAHSHRPLDLLIWERPACASVHRIHDREAGAVRLLPAPGPALMEATGW